MAAEQNNLIEVELKDNIKICLNTGYGMLLSSEKKSNYRNAIVLIHNGLELMMKLYLYNKNKYLIYEHIDQYMLLKEHIDNFDSEKKREVNRKVKSNTISFNKCVDLLDYFLEISKPDIKKLNDIRNNCVHFEVVMYKAEVRKLLVSKIYPLIIVIANALGEDISAFLNKSSVLDAWCSKINDVIQSQYIQTTAAAQKHYWEELTERDREEKRLHENYTIHKNSKKVFCPACENNSLLETKTVYSIDEDEGIRRTTKSQMLKNFSCHYCGLIINDRDQLMIDFSSFENSITISETYDLFHDCPEDCPDEYYDCPDDYDCPDEYYDCPDDYDCPDEYYDCPDDYDCPNEYYDCPDDCPDEYDDCSDDCLDEYDDCPDDCPDEYDDCPNND